MMMFGLLKNWGVQHTWISEVHHLFTSSKQSWINEAQNSDMGRSRLTLDPLLLSSDWCHLCACFLSVINQCKKINNRKQHGGTSLNTATAWKCPHFAHVLMRKVPKLPRVLTNIYVQVDVHTFSLYLIFKTDSPQCDFCVTLVTQEHAQRDR